MNLRLIARNVLIWRQTKCTSHALQSMNRLFHTLNGKPVLNATKQCHKSYALMRRQLSDDQHNHNNGLKPPLMTFKPIVFPSIWSRIKNWITIHTIIAPYFDNHFTLQEFVDGSKQALVHISNRLADGDTDSLKGLVTHEALTEIRDNLPKLSAKQLQELRVDPKDIIYTFVDTIGIIMNDSNNRWVEITVVYYCLYKYHKLTQTRDIPFKEFKDKFGPNITICNYRFIRDYTKGVDSDWSVNLLAHFNNNDLMKGRL